MSNAKLTAVIDADTTPLTSGISKAMGSLRGFLTLGALAAAARQAIAYGSAINDAGLKTGVGVKWLQATAYAAKMAGSSLEDLTTGLVELRRAQAQALGGSTADLSAFTQLGITVEQLRGLSTEALFDRVAEAVQRTGGGLQEVNAALQVLGRGGRGLLAGMVDGFTEARMEAERLGLVLSEDVISAMDGLGDRLDTLNLGFTALTAVILKNMMSLNNWLHLMRLVQEARQSVDIVRVGAAFANGGAAGVVRHFAERAATMEGIIDSYSAEEQRDSKRKLPSGSEFIGGGKAKDQGLDRLARLGIFAGGGASSGSGLVRIQTQALAQLREMKAYLRRMADRQPGVDW